MYDLTSGSWGRIKGIGTRPQYPFWSPDGQFIAYFQFPPDRLMKIPATGGVAETICTVASLAWGGSWGADSTIVFAQSDGIFRVPAGGGDRIQVTQVDAEKGEVAHEWPHFLPDGRHFTYYAMGKPDGLYLASVDPREPRREFKKTIPSQAFVASGFLLTAGGGVLRAQPLSPDGITVGEAVPLDSNVRQLRAAAGYRAFAASPTVLAYSTDSAPRRFQFALIDRARQEPSAVGPPVLLADQLLGEALTWSLSPDGLSVAFTEQSADRPGSHLGLLDVTRGVTAPLTEGHTPRWAPSGDRIVFTRGDEKGQDLFVKRLGTDSEVRVGDSNDLMKVAYDWHPDGRTILSGMPTPPKMHYTFWLLGADGDPKPRQWFPVNVFRHVAAQFSPPDGRWVAYESYESGAAEVYVRRFPSGDGKEKISRAGGRLPRWRPDGKALFYLQDDMLMEVDLQVGATVKPGVLRPLFKIGNSVGYAVHPDGKRFVLCRPIDPIPPPTITIVLNWAAGLKPK